VEQHDQLTGWRPGGERVKGQPTGRELERFDHVAWVTEAVGQSPGSPGPYRRNSAGAQQGATRRGAGTGRPQDWMRAITSVEEFPTRTPERSHRDALFGSPVIGSRRVLGERASRVARACCQATSSRSQSDARGAEARKPCCDSPSMVATTLTTQALMPGPTGRHQMKSVPLLSSQDGPGRVHLEG
jgi:hypothetical protein